MLLTDTKIRTIKLTNKAQKLYNERGLFLQITAAGTKSWRFRYYFQDKEKLLMLATQPLKKFSPVALALWSDFKLQ